MFRFTIRDVLWLTVVVSAWQSEGGGYCPAVRICRRAIEHEQNRRKGRSNTGK
jgi:hypothetical protein